MGRVELNFFEKMYIYSHCCRDIKNNKFSGVKIGELARNKYFAENADNLFSDDEYTINVFDKTIDEIKVISPFIITELSYLIAKKNQLLEKKWCVYKLITNNNTIYYRMKKFPDAIAEIDDIIRKLESDISCINEEYKASIAELQEKYNSNIAREDYHLANANVKIAHTKKGQFRIKKQAVYEHIIFLLSEKIRLINIIDSRINIVKDWRFLRIRHYYGLACNKEHKLPLLVYSEKDFSWICGEPLGDDYTGKLDATENKYNKIKNEISYPNEIVIKEVEDISDDNNCMNETDDVNYSDSLDYADNITNSTESREKVNGEA